MRRGVKGARTGRPDVPLPATQPVQTPTGLPYGEAGQLAQLQRQVPLARQGTPGGPGTPPGGPDFGQVLQAARGMTPPDRPLNAPTQRPNESITAGLGRALPSPPVDTGTQFILQLAQSPDAPAALRQLGAYIASGRS